MPAWTVDNAVALCVASCLLLIAGAGCAPDITETDFYSLHPEQLDPQAEPVELAALSEQGLQFRALARDWLHYGSNTVWIEVSLDRRPVSEGRLTVTPGWITEARSLVFPLARSATVATDVEGRFEGQPFFLQPVDEEGSWTVAIDYDVLGRQGKLAFPVDVEPELWVQHVEGQEAYYVSWLSPASPATGRDELELALHCLTDEGFASIEDAAIELYPYMDMGSGDGHSTPYEAPQHVGDGLYRGTVNFIMSGGWDMTVFVQRPGAEADTVIFRGFTVR